MLYRINFLGGHRGFACVLVELWPQRNQNGMEEPSIPWPQRIGILGALCDLLQRKDRGPGSAICPAMGVLLD